MVDVKSPDPVAGMVLPGLAAPGYMATQVDIINSDRVAQRVVKLLRMDESPADPGQWMDATSGKGELAVWLADMLKQKLDVKPSRESNVINIEFSGTDPDLSPPWPMLLHRLISISTSSLRVEPARQYATWFEDQTKALRDKLGKSPAGAFRSPAESRHYRYR